MKTTIALALAVSVTVAACGSSDDQSDSVTSATDPVEASARSRAPRNSGSAITSS